MSAPPHDAKAVFEYVDRLRELPPATSIEAEIRNDRVSTFSNPTAAHRHDTRLVRPSEALYGSPSTTPALPVEAFEAPSMLRRTMERDHPRPERLAAGKTPAAGSPSATLRRARRSSLLCDKIGVPMMSGFLRSVGCADSDCVTANDYSVRIARALAQQYDIHAPLSTAPQGRGPNGAPANPAVMRRLDHAEDDDPELLRSRAHDDAQLSMAQSNSVEPLKRRIRELEFDIDRLERRLAMCITQTDVRLVENATGRLRESVTEMRQEIGFISGDIVEAFREWTAEFNALPAVKEARTQTTSKLRQAAGDLSPQESLLAVPSSTVNPPGSGNGSAPARGSDMSAGAVLRATLKIVDASSQSAAHRTGIFADGVDFTDLDQLTAYIEAQLANDPVNKIQKAVAEGVGAYTGSEKPLVTKAVRGAVWMLRAAERIESLEKARQDAEARAKGLAEQAAAATEEKDNLLLTLKAVQSAGRVVSPTGSPPKGRAGAVSPTGRSPAAVRPTPQPSPKAAPASPQASAKGSKGARKPPPKGKEPAPAPTPKAAKKEPPKAPKATEPPSAPKAPPLSKTTKQPASADDDTAGPAAEFSLPDVNTSFAVPLSPGVLSAGEDSLAKSVGAELPFLGTPAAASSPAAAVAARSVEDAPTRELTRPELAEVVVTALSDAPPAARTSADALILWLRTGQCVSMPFQDSSHHTPPMVASVQQPLANVAPATAAPVPVAPQPTVVPPSALAEVAGPSDSFGAAVEEPPSSSEPTTTATAAAAVAQPVVVRARTDAMADSQPTASTTDVPPAPSAQPGQLGASALSQQQQSIPAQNAALQEAVTPAGRPAAAVAMMRGPGRPTTSASVVVDPPSSPSTTATTASPTASTPHAPPAPAAAQAQQGTPSSVHHQQQAAAAGPPPRAASVPPAAAGPASQAEHDLRSPQRIHTPPLVASTPAPSPVAQKLLRFRVAPAEAKSPQPQAKPRAVTRGEDEAKLDRIRRSLESGLQLHKYKPHDHLLFDDACAVPMPARTAEDEALVRITSASET